MEHLVQSSLVLIIWSLNLFLVAESVDIFHLFCARLKETVEKTRVHLLLKL